MLALDAVAVGLGPDVGLHVGDPGAAHVEVEPAQRAALQPRAAADPVARLQDADRLAARLELARGDEPRQAGADHEDVDHAGEYRSRRSFALRQAATSTRARASSRDTPRLPQRAASA